MTKYYVYYDAVIEVEADNPTEAEELADDLLTISDMDCIAVESDDE